MPRSRWTPCPEPACPELRDRITGNCPNGHGRTAWAGMGHGNRLRKSGWQRQRDSTRTLTQHRGICHVCGQPGATQVDHVKPLAEGGTDTDDNRRPIHADPCHTDKTRAEAVRGRRAG